MKRTGQEGLSSMPGNNSQVILDNYSYEFRQTRETSLRWRESLTS